MIQNVEYWTTKVRELRIAITKTDDPYVVKSYHDLIDAYQGQIDKANAEAKLAPEDK